MTEPLVVAVMLTKDRTVMAKRAVECFRKQTYHNKRLYIYDTGRTPCTDSWPDVFPDQNIRYHRGLVGEVVTIGMLRNRANWWAVRPTATSPPDADILIHFDDDDYSHPNRISEQVTLLEASGKQCVGYRDLLFLNERRCAVCFDYETCACGHGEAWLYHNDDPRYCTGTSLCYWRETWEKRPFKDISRGEDKEFLRDLDTLGVSSVFGNSLNSNLPICTQDPRMIASIHSGNHVVYEPEKSLPPPAGNWKRVPEWDDYTRKAMTL